MPLRSLEFDRDAFEDLAWWIENDRSKALRIVRFIKDIGREPFSGIGKPEPLKHDLKGCWSRRIDQEHLNSEAAELEQSNELNPKQLSAVLVERLFIDVRF